MNSPLKDVRQPRQSGAAVVEFALVLPIFVLVLYILISFGVLFYAQLVVSRAATDGARALVVLPGVSSLETLTETQKDSIKQQVINSLAVSLAMTADSGEYAERLALLQSEVLPRIRVDGGGCGTDGAAGLVRVEVRFPYDLVRILPPITLPMVGSVGGGLFDTLTGCAVANL
ncbi:TadE/TadG family type IV pilus assembly protein [Sinimarinibacterium flocculans]|uniref:Flp pilus assembly protein TadG n=1 Tax=Sinimarinibacterium flocculans TaxID=985250 RepID=A0A318EAH6_9GAMM|nr:TadE/TadG family type IV pilus assembly protein [Sinimarinibacterium flocculans]PXV64213.1 Flp pilus assembly protein TadG [Sinimarinibacterium flocculans]